MSGAPYYFPDLRKREHVRSWFLHLNDYDGQGFLDRQGERGTDHLLAFVRDAVERGVRSALGLRNAGALDTDAIVDVVLTTVCGPAQPAPGASAEKEWT